MKIKKWRYGMVTKVQEQDSIKYNTHSRKNEPF